MKRTDDIGRWISIMMQQLREISTLRNVFDPFALDRTSLQLNNEYARGEIIPLFSTLLPHTSLLHLDEFIAVPAHYIGT